MPTIAALNQVVTELSGVGPGLSLTAWETCYTSPIAKAYQQMRDWEVQVIDLGASLGNRDGTFRRETFQIQIAMFVRLAGDYGGRHYELLKDTTNGLHARQASIITELDLNYLLHAVDGVDVPYLDAPLHLISIGSVVETKFESILCKSLIFQGGMNNGLI